MIRRFWFALIFPLMPVAAWAAPVSTSWFPAAPPKAESHPYFRLFDAAHLQKGAGFLISPKDPKATFGIVDVALVTHSTSDGTLCDRVNPSRSWCIPESWVPLQLGLGGSFNGEATVAPGTSANLSPIIAATVLRGIDKNSSGWAQAVKAAFQAENGSGLRLGGALAGVAVRQGHFQSAKAAFPGRGIGEILGNAARVDVGYSWKL